MLSALLLAAVGPRLVSLTQLPAATFREGPTSGQFIRAANGVEPPFVLKQPVQGFSAAVRAPAGRIVVLSDNGYGSKANSADFVLTYHSLRWAPRAELIRSFPFSDPYRRVPWNLVADRETYPDSPFPVDTTIREGRLLTGFDFDPESLRQASDGTLWVGDEFGPFLLHFDVAGRLLEAPISLPGVRSPDHPVPLNPPNLGGSKGFEGMAFGEKPNLLVCLLEGPIAGEADPRNLRMFEFDTRAKSWTNLRWTYRMEDPAHAIGDLTWLEGEDFLVIERDNGQGEAAKFKKVFLWNRGTGTKTEAIDLLNIADPLDLDGNGSPAYRMPFVTIESLVVLDRNTVLVLNDNNYPFSNGRTSGRPDDNEIAEIRWR